MSDRFTEHARNLIEAKLLNHSDEGVRAITAMFGVPDEAVEKVAAKLRKEAAELAAIPDDEIDCSDIPEITDWAGAVRGKFTASAIEAAEAGETPQDGSTEGESATRQGDAQPSQSPSHTPSGEK